MRVIVCGGRDFNDKDFFYKTMNDLFIKEDEMLPPPDLFIISGGAKGADSLASDWCVLNWVSFKEFKADWNKYGKSAGPIRNQQMIGEGKPDLVLAFPGGTGTADMARRAEQAGVPVNRIKP